MFTKAMSPDPPTDPLDGCLSFGQDVVLAPHSSDDSDNEEETPHAYDGYTLLGQQDVPHGVVDSDSEVAEREREIREDAQIVQVEPTAPSPAGEAELMALWNKPVDNTLATIRMDAERSEQIRAAMAGFSLPPSAVPAWAADIPEEQWKQRLLDRLQIVLHTSQTP